MGTAFIYEKGCCREKEDNLLSACDRHNKREEAVLQGQAFWSGIGKKLPNRELSTGRPCLGRSETSIDRLVRRISGRLRSVKDTLYSCLWSAQED